MSTQDPDEFYERLKGQLEENSAWPSTYLYKFIVPTDQVKIDQIYAIFDQNGAVIESKQSKKGNYTSVSITVTMPNPEAVIEKYKEVSSVEGVISL